MSRLPKDHVHESFWKGETFSISFDDCNDRATTTVEEIEKQSVIVLKEMHNRCPTKVREDDLRQYFEKEFIDKLREQTVSRSAEVLDIWGFPPEPSPSPTPSKKPSQPTRWSSLLSRGRLNVVSL